MVSIILANVGTVICFRTGNPEDERLLLPLFSPYIEQGEVSNLPAFNFYAKLSAIKPQEPFSGQTLLLEDAGNLEIAQEVVKLSRKLFAKKQEPLQETKDEVEPAKPQPKNEKRTKKKKGLTSPKPIDDAPLSIEDVMG